MSSKSERENVISALASTIFSAMLDDIVLDAALQSHHEVTRSRSICNVCHTRCGLAHVPGPSTQAVAPPSRPTTPALEAAASSGSLGTGTSTPTSVKADGTIYLDCVNCNRPISSNRYAPHLSSCLGIGTGTRRGAARSIHTKPSNPSEGGRSASPSEAGNISDNSKDKGKTKSKLADDAEFYLKRKRRGSPQVSPQKKQKRPKAPVSPVARVKTEPDAQGIPSNTHQSTSSTSQSKVPSKLRESSTAPFIDREGSSSPDSPSSSPTTPVASTSTSTSSALSTHSPSLAKKANGMGNKRKGKAVGLGSPQRPSPPRPPPPLVRAPEPDYLIDVEGEETGSSTDTDSP